MLPPKLREKTDYKNTIKGISFIKMKVQTVNLERGMPTVAFAHSHLNQALRTAKASGFGVVKFIHGYGSSGRGGAIKKDVHETLSEKQSAGIIKTFCPGEDFSAFDARARKIIDACPEMRRDIDYGRTNHGITVVLL